MVNYSNGKVYKIEPVCEHDEGDIYIGSTTKQYLSQRLDTHRSQYKLWKSGQHHKTMSFDLFEKYGVENCQIVLLELVNATSKDELLARERHYIKTSNTVNKQVPGRKQEEYYEDNKPAILERVKQYRENNKDKILEQKHKYKMNNSENIRQHNQTYYNKNKAEIALKHKKYIEDNKHILQARINCECGGKKKKNRHEIQR
jgi:hypothetical protein